MVVVWTIGVVVKGTVNVVLGVGIERQLQAVEISAVAKAVKQEGRAGVGDDLDDVDCF